MSSRLFTEVRERRGLAYSVRASLSPYQDTGNLAIQAGLTKAKIDEGISVILQELSKVARKGVKTDGPMAPEVDLSKARPADDVYSSHVERELANEAPLVLNFVFTTCSTSCSLQTAVLAQLQRDFLARGRRLQLASITIDPENDTPDQLRRFAANFHVAPGWQFYTGRFDDLLRVQKHFDVYRGSKASHPPVLLLRRHARAPWVRVEGFPQATELSAVLDSLPAGA